jgi:hypothetical protein
MARKKATEVAAPPEAQGQTVEQTPDPPVSVAVKTQEPAPAPAPTPAEGGERPRQEKRSEEPKRPKMSWAVNSDKSTRIEVAAWVNLMKLDNGEEYEQVTLTVTRSYKTIDNGWQRGGSWRTHDVPILLFLLQQAYTWSVSRRMTVRVDGEEVPW